MGTYYSPEILKDRVALITGAGRGIGKQIASIFVEHGARVVIASRSQHELHEVASTIGHRVSCHVVDVACPESCQSLIGHALQRYGKIDILINNAGTVNAPQRMTDQSEEESEKLFAVTCHAPRRLSLLVAKHLMGRSAPGVIVNITSVAGLQAAHYQGAYGMAKAAIHSMTQTLACELGPKGIRVNSIAPGLVNTKLAESVIQNKGLLEKILGKTPLRRYAEPREIAEVALFLASDASGFITGQVLAVDGGISL